MDVPVQPVPRAAKDAQIETRHAARYGLLITRSRDSSMAVISRMSLAMVVTVGHPVDHKNLTKG